MDNPQNIVQYKIFENHKNILAFTSTKQTLNNRDAHFTGDSTEVVQENRKELAAVLDINASQLLFPRQTHTNCVAEILEIPENEISETDALVSNKIGICLCIQTADCVPILLFDPVQEVIAAVHAGWRGSVNKIVEVAVQKMISEYNSSPKDILAAIGPSISPEVYEVGDEVVKAAKSSIPNSEKTLLINKARKFHFNLWEANRQLLLQTGLQTDNIEILGECSYQNSDKYFSARKEGIDTGRMVSGIMILPPSSR
jgi:YfiH family protein